jgi:hypothetical protein
MECKRISTCANELPGVQRNFWVCVQINYQLCKVISGCTNKLPGVQRNYQVCKGITRCAKELPGVADLMAGVLQGLEELALAQAHG